MLLTGAEGKVDSKRYIEQSARLEKNGAAQFMIECMEE
jgi:hypothetical protein